MRILIVEDNPTDRELLRYLLSSCFEDVVFMEAPDLHTAFVHLGGEHVDLIILDLQLPDSVGKPTFVSLHTRYPSIPIVVMTHNKDRGLALDMIKAGAADYLLKDYTNEEDVYQRITFAVEKAKHTVRLPTEQTPVFERLNKARSGLAIARRSGQMKAIRDNEAETTDAIAEMSRQMYGELRKLSEALTEQATRSESTNKIVEALDKELLRGHSGRPSMRSQMDLMDHRLGGVEMGLVNVKKNVHTVEDTQNRAALEVTTTRLTNRTKLLLGILALVGTVSAAIIGYYETIHKPDPPPKIEKTK